MKKKFIVIISGIALLAVSLCVVLFNKDGISNGRTGASVSGTNSLDVSYTASINIDSVNVDTDAKIVVVTVKTNKEVELDSIDGTVIIPEGIELIAMENEKLLFVENTDYNPDNGHLAYVTKDAENKTTDDIVKITYSVPTGTPAGDYDLGFVINCITKDYGMDIWEEDATAKVTLTVEG